MDSNEEVLMQNTLAALNKAYDVLFDANQAACHAMQVGDSIQDRCKSVTCYFVELLDTAIENFEREFESKTKKEKKS